MSKDRRSSAEKNMVHHIMKSVIELVWSIILNQMTLIAHQGIADSTYVWKPTSTWYVLRLCKYHTKRRRDRRLPWIGNWLASQFLVTVDANDKCEIMQYTQCARTYPVHAWGHRAVTTIMTSCVDMIGAWYVLGRLVSSISYIKSISGD